MKLLEHYIIEIYSEKDISEDFKKVVGEEPDEPLIEVDLLYNCYGVEERRTLTFFKSNLDRAKEQGYFMAY